MRCRLSSLSERQTEKSASLLHRESTSETSLAMERRIRLRHTGDVRRVYDEGRSWAHPLLVLVARPNELDFSRVGVTASRSVGNAVARNRAKRLLREAARHLYPQFETGWDVMLVARAGILKVKVPQVEEALALLLGRAMRENRENRK